MPEGDSLHRIARALQPLVGERISIETPHPKARLLGLGRLDGLRVESIAALGKHLLIHFENGLVLRSHLGMNGRWHLLPAGTRLVGAPWLILRGERHLAAQWKGPTLEVVSGTPSLTLGPDILAEPFDLERMLAGLRAAAQERELGDVLIDQRLIAGIGNIWRAEGLWQARLSPWRSLARTSDAELRRLLSQVGQAMRISLTGQRPARAVYRRTGRPCSRCGARIRSQAQGDAARTIYWCPTCQPD